MQILFINNDGSGFADQIQIAEGMTVEALFQQRVSHGRPQDYLIRVNRQPTTADYILQEGDRVSITPYKCLLSTIISSIRAPMGARQRLKSHMLNTALTSSEEIRPTSR